MKDALSLSSAHSNKPTFKRQNHLFNEKLSRFYYMPNTAANMLYGYGTVLVLQEPRQLREELSSDSLLSISTTAWVRF